jgi:hypothetical protein
VRFRGTEATEVGANAFGRSVAAASDVSYLLGRKISRNYHIVNYCMLRCCWGWRHTVGKSVSGGCTVVSENERRHRVKFALAGGRLSQSCDRKGLKCHLPAKDGTKFHHKLYLLLLVLCLLTAMPLSYKIHIRARALSGQAQGARGGAATTRQSACSFHALTKDCDDVVTPCSNNITH